MKSEEKKETKIKAGDENSLDFKGYNLEEIRYQRAIVALKKEFAKEKMMADISEIKKRLPFQKENKQTGVGFPLAKGLVGKALSGLGYVDYFLLGFSVISTGKKIFSFFRKKK